MEWILFWGCLLLILCLASPFFGLILYMGILYLRPMEVYPMLAPFHVARIFAIAVIVGFLIRYGGQKRIFFNQIQDKILVALLVVIMLSFSVGWAYKCMQVLEQMAKNVVIYALIIGMVTSERKLKVLLLALLVYSAILGFNTFQEYRALDPTALYVRRLGGFSGGYFGGAGDFAVMMNVAIPFAFFLGIAGRPLVLRPVTLFLMAVLIAGMVATQARGGVITFGVVVLGIAYFGMKSPGIWKKVIIILLILGLLAGIVAFAPAAFKDRAATIADYKHQVTAMRRIEYWKLGIKMFLSNPLIGVGAGNYPMRYWDFGGWERKWRVPHNMYIEALAELGILGFGCLFFLLYYTFKDGMFTERLLKKNNRTGSFLYIANQGAVVSLLAYCIGGMFQSVFKYPILYIIIAIIIAIKNTAVTSVRNEA